MAISHLTYIKDASGLAQAKGLPSLIYHEPAIEVKFMRGAAGTTRILTIRQDSFQRLRIFLLKRPRSFIEGPNGTIDTRK